MINYKHCEFKRVTQQFLAQPLPWSQPDVAILFSHLVWYALDSETELNSDCLRLPVNSLKSTWIWCWRIKGCKWTGAMSWYLWAGCWLAGDSWLGAHYLHNQVCLQRSLSQPPPPPPSALQLEAALSWYNSHWPRPANHWHGVWNIAQFSTLSAFFPHLFITEQLWYDKII